jgi:small GTP-binding protein
MSSTPLEIKVCIIGDSGVGKTALSTRFCHEEFPDTSNPTIGASFLQRRVLVETTEISLQIWDTAGQERFRSMAPMYYRGAKAAVCVFDITNEESFNRVTTWIRDLKAHADPNVVICLAGNKCDKTPNFDLAKCEEQAKSIEGEFFLTSALTGEGVQELFDNLSRKIYEVYKNQRQPSKDYDSLNLANKTPPSASTGCCN